MYGRGEVMCSVGAPGCGTRPLFYPRDGGVRIRGINAWPLVGLHITKNG